MPLHKLFKEPLGPKPSQGNHILKLQNRMYLFYLAYSSKIEHHTKRQPRKRENSLSLSSVQTHNQIPTKRVGEISLCVHAQSQKSSFRERELLLQSNFFPRKMKSTLY